ncbi:MAG: hypothetical protein HY348_07330 [Nitrospira defluvii]|nr:hypothetical protein [Nitrospira defluvii]
MDYTLYFPDQSRGTISAESDCMAQVLAWRILKTRGKWIFICDVPE